MINFLYRYAENYIRSLYFFLIELDECLFGIRAGFMDQGNLVASQYVQGQVIRPNYTATIGQPCSGASINGSMGRQLSFGIQNGDIARDSDGSGRTVVCMNGVWQPMVATLQVSSYALPNGTNLSESIGRHRFCALADTFESDDSSKDPNAVRVWPGAYGSDGKYEWILSRGALGWEGGGANCFD